MENNYNFWHGATAGACAGATAAAVSYPFAAIKKMIQSKQSISASTFIPKNIYRGVGSYTLLNFPVTMIQVGLNRQILHLSENNSMLNQITTALSVGFLSGFFLAPVESLMLKQQQQKCSAVKAWMHVLKTQGFSGFMRGGMAIGIRESIYALAILWGSEAAGKHLTDIFGINLTLVGTLLVSVCSAPASHPFDVIATYQQCSSTDTSFTRAAKNIFLEQSMKGFYKGLLPRLGIFAISIPVAVETKKIVLRTLENQ